MSADDAKDTPQVMPDVTSVRFVLEPQLLTVHYWLWNKRGRTFCLAQIAEGRRARAGEVETGAKQGRNITVGDHYKTNSMKANQHAANTRTAFFRFYEELNDFLFEDQRGATFPYEYIGKPSIKDTVEAIGVPHTEIDLILVDGESV